MPKSEDHQTSPKKRRIYTADSTPAKTKNAKVQTQAARERAERQAAEHDRQIASRQTRALKRSTPTTTARGLLVKRLPNRMPFKSTRITTVNFQHRVPRSGALKPVKQSARSRTIARSTHLARISKTRPQRQDIPSTPTRASSDSDDDASPNITPASLRSASRRSMPTGTPLSGRSEEKIRTEHNTVRPRKLRTFAMHDSRSQHRAYTAAHEDVQNTSIDVKALHHPAQSRSRSTSGR
jgi:palmitoyltransferase ZDHHC9/14/18